MSRTDKGVLQRVDLEAKLPVGFAQLSDEAKRKVIEKMADQDVELFHRLQEKVAKSRIAEQDLEVMVNIVERLDAERKIYSQHSKGETGSGTYDMKIRGGDTKFIIPILVVLGLVILGIVLIVALA